MQNYRESSEVILSVSAFVMHIFFFNFIFLFIISITLIPSILTAQFPTLPLFEIAINTGTGSRPLQEGVEALQGWAALCILRSETLFIFFCLDCSRFKWGSLSRFAEHQGMVVETSLEECPPDSTWP